MGEKSKARPAPSWSATACPAGDLPWRHAGAGPIRWLRKTKFKNVKYFNYTWRMRWKPCGSASLGKRRSELGARIRLVPRHSDYDSLGVTG
jgi:hypothetical protein